MTRIAFTVAATLLAGTALAQTGGTQTPGNSAPGATSNAPMPGVNPNTGTTPNTSFTGRNSGTAAAAGDRNQAVTTTTQNAPQPARGANSFTQGEARRRIERHGYSNVTGLHKDNGGVWRATASKGGGSHQVWLDYKGNVGEEGMGGAPSTSGASMGNSSMNGTGMGTTGMGGSSNPPGTAATRALDRAAGTNTSGAYPGQSDGTAANPPGTAAGRTMDRALGTNTTGANPGGNNATGTTR